eukprot:PhF_6_TR43086/c2_g1_i1/m.65796
MQRLAPPTLSPAVIFGSHVATGRSPNRARTALNVMRCASTRNATLFRITRMIIIKIQRCLQIVHPMVSAIWTTDSDVLAKRAVTSKHPNATRRVRLTNVIPTRNASGIHV